MRGFVLLALLASSLAGCGGDRSAGLPIHLVDDPKIRRDVPFVTWGEVVSLDGDPRQVLSSVPPVMPPSEVLPQPEGPRMLRAPVPPSVAGLPWLLYEVVAARGDAMRMLRSWPGPPAKFAGKTWEVWVPEHRIQPDETPAVRLWPVPDLAIRDAETGDVVVPPHAALKLGVGLQPASFDSTILPIDMTVSAVAADGASTPLRTIRMDPRVPAQRKWVDVAIPLDALAGQTVRFKFTARSIMGSTAMATLPLWADPTIVDAANVTGAP
jgi:hypothetical protein